MWTTLRQGNLNRNAVLAEAVKNGDAVVLKLNNGELQAYKAVVAGGDVQGFATVIPTDPNINLFPQTVDTFITANTAFNNLETLPAGLRVLIEEGTGTAETTRVQAGTYKNGDALACHTDGSLKKAGTGDFKIAEARETKIIATGDKLYIQYCASDSFVI
jgi:hypothetical protein